MSADAEPTTDARAHEPFNLTTVLAGLKQARKKWRNAHHSHIEYGAHGFPSRLNLERIVSLLSAALFPLRLGPPELKPANEDAFVEATLETALSRLTSQIRLELVYSDSEASDATIEARVGTITSAFAASLPDLRHVLDSDVEAAYAGDPAARSVDEVLLCYPCIIAIIHHRIAHKLHQLGAPLVARIVSETANSSTGIDIHPGAQIGHSFFIDHGTGVVIGETAIIGNRVRLYQAVTLGAKRFSVEADGNLARGGARHPIIEDDVVIYSGATILGRVKIGQGSVIGGNVWITQDVAPGSNVRQRKPTLSIERDDVI
jgi:serine O-acetyltransferase